MKTSEKLKIILKLSWSTQEKLAQKFWVSFVAFNAWINEKSNPRKKALEKIDIFYLELTGQNIIPDSQLLAKKDLIFQKAKKYKSTRWIAKQERVPWGILDFILNRRDIYEQFLVSLTYHTNSIEWSTLSENETAQILFENKNIKNKTLIEQLEAKNHQTALNFLFNYLQDKKNKIDENLILKLHSILMNSIYQNAWFYRDHWVRILWSNIITANHLKIPILMEKLSKEFENFNWNIIKKASEIHAKFEKIHPFSDWNWRIWRLLIHLMLLKNNLPPVLIKQENKSIYYAVLQKAQLKEDYSLLEDFICDGIFNSFEIIE